MGALWNCFNQDDFLPILEEILYDDYNNQLAEKIVKVCVETSGGVKIYFKDGTFNLINKEVIENYSTVEFERVINLMTDKDAFTKIRKVDLVRRLRERDERHATDKAEKEENAIIKAKEIEMFEKRSNELKSKELSRISPDGVFLNIKTHIFSIKIDLDNTFKIQNTKNLKIQDYQSTNHSIIELESRQMQLEECKIKGQDELGKGGS
ncbi:hypothetical protein AgCh_033061 [Apium graveolens]